MNKKIRPLLLGFLAVLILSLADAGPAAPASLISELARYAMGLRLADAPEVVRRQAKLCILDTIGASVAGISAEDWRPLLEVERARSGRTEATVLGAGTKLSIEAAARVNAYTGDIFEVNDLIGGHASIGIVPAVLAVSETTAASGAEVVEAVIVGIEVASHVYSSYYYDMKAYTEVGMVPVGFPNSLGAAAAVARLLNLDERHTAEAMAIAGTLAGWCPAEVIFGDGGTVKPMVFGASPATTGITAAYYAQKGMSGPPNLLESKIGLYATVAKRSKPDVLVDRNTWYLAKPRRKLHACCGYLHSALDVIIALRREGARFQDAAEIRIGMPEYIIPAISKTRPPVSPNDARFHAQFMLALAASESNVIAIAPEHSMQFQTYSERPAVAELMKKIKVVLEPELKHYHQCSVTLLDSAGTTMLRREGKGPKGSPQNPMTDDEVRAKFRQLVGHKLGPAKVDEYLTKLDGLDKPGDWHWLINSFK
ncbi:MAG: MmgE/PrpD family protein [Thermodesulfobacteriota bacterium]